ncbi:MAG: hypothetical protein AAF577_08985 [Pseudomonadota bacterium]
MRQHRFAGPAALPAAFPAAFLAALALIAGCTEPTRYAERVERDGYADSAIEENRFRVSFSGNTRTSRDTVETYLLYRAAEVTLADGKDWFRVADQDTETETRFRAFATGFGSGGFGPYFYRSGFRHGFFGGAASTTSRPITRYEAYANILTFEGEKPAEDPTAYDARSVLETLGPQIIRPEPVVNASG